jgi:hypothetical protein
MTANPAPCDEWTLVNNGAFDLDLAPYSAEEGFEVVVFKGQLYLGMEADNSLGARLWRTKPGVTIPISQSNWEEVAADEFGNPFGNSNRAQNDHIDSLASFDGFLYASTANRSGDPPSGTLIYRSQDGNPNSWIPVNLAGFGDPANENFKDMIVFQSGGVSTLCGGTVNSSTGAQVWCSTDGLTWFQANSAGFGDPDNAIISSSAVYVGALYFGVTTDAGGLGSLWRTSNLVDWENVYQASDRGRVDVLDALNGYLYLAEGDSNGLGSSDQTIRLLRSPNGDSGSWYDIGSQVGTDAHNTRSISDGALAYNAALYISVMNNTSGVQIWRTDGNDWSLVNEPGFNHSSSFAAQLAVFNGYLYAWTSDYTRGQEVLRSKCGLEETLAIDGAGTYPFDSVGATLKFSFENLDSVTVVAYPDAFPTGQSSGLPVKRFYEVTANPPNGTFSASLSLTYSETELNAVGFIDEGTTYLTRWNGNSWIDCPEPTRNRDVLLNTVTCADITEFSTWAIAGEDHAPSTLQLERFEANPFANHLPNDWIVIGFLTILCLCLVNWVSHRR